MNIKKYASHSDFKGFGCEIVNNRYPQTYSPTDNYYLPKHLTIYNKIVEILHENHSDIT